MGETRGLDESDARDTLRFLGFDEVGPGRFVRLDTPDGRTDEPATARFVTTVHLKDVRDVRGLARVVRRFSRVHGPLDR